VVAPAPRLEACVEGLPATLFHGQLHRCTLRLVNVGPTHAALHRLKLNCSDGALLCGRARVVGVRVCAQVRLRLCAPPTRCPSPPSPNPTAAVPTVQEAEAADTARPAKGAEGAFAFAFPASTTLEGGGAWDTTAMASAAAVEGTASGAHLQWPLWVRPAAPGPLVLRLVLYYEPRTPAPPSAPLQYRLLRLRTAVQVLPSLRMAATAAPTAAHATRQLLRVEVHNLAAAHALSLRHLTLLPPPTTPAAPPIAPQSTRAAAAAAAAAAHRSRNAARHAADAVAAQPPLALVLSPLLGTPLPTADVHGGVPVQPLASLSLLLHAAASTVDPRAAAAAPHVGGRMILEAGAARSLSASQAAADSELVWPLQQFHRRQRGTEAAASERASEHGRGGAAGGSPQGDWRADLVLVWEAAAAQHADSGGGGASERCVATIREYVGWRCFQIGRCPLSVFKRRIV
jgi:hypothetical protein